MAAEYQPIALLPLEAQAQIRSSVQVTSLSDVIVELVKNSLDANADNISIQLDFLKGYCAILDNGVGIPRSEFVEDGGLAQLYHTSRNSHSQFFYGRYGRFLASLASVSLLSITSRHISEASSNSTTLQDGQRVLVNPDMNDEDINRQSYGTKIIVHNLFGKMPVRVKHRISQLSAQHRYEREFFSLKQCLVGLVLAAPRPFFLDVRSGPHRYLHRPRVWSRDVCLDTDNQLEQVVSTMFQADLVHSISTDNWRQASSRSSGISIRAFFCLQPTPSKLAQYISLNQYSLALAKYKILYDQVNNLFDCSTFGCVEDGEECMSNMDHPLRPSSKSFAGSKKGVDKWPAFCIQVALDISHRVDETTGPEAEKITTLIDGSLNALVTEFLQMHDFRIREPRQSRAKQQESSTHTSDVFHFDTWSQIKSGNSTPVDLLDGLPFISDMQQHTRLYDAERSLKADLGSDESVVEEDIVLWRHPRTGNLLKIDQRTGMVIPPQRNEPYLATADSLRLRGCKKLSDVADTLQNHLPSVRMERAVGSVVPEHESLTSGTHQVALDDRKCVIGDCRQLCVAGPISGEAMMSSVSKMDLKTANVLGQVDEKFVLASVVSESSQQTTLLLIDQHAADERVKVEQLFQQLCSSKSAPLPTPIIFEVNREELKRFRRMQSYFARWHVHYSVLTDQIRVSALPELIIERCRLEPKTLIGLLRREIWQDHPVSIEGANATHWLNMIGGCPQGILDMLASRACRTAVMFNDKLTLDQCQELIQRLAACLFPFQCAHGRPSLTMLADYREVGIFDEMEMKDSSFGVGWKAWNT